MLAAPCGMPPSNSYGSSTARKPKSRPRFISFVTSTDLVNAGVSLETIRRRLGHANAQTVLRYADLRDTTADAEIRTWRRRRTTRRPNS